MSRPKLISTVLCLAALALSGCFRISYRVASTTGDTYHARYWNHFFVAGLIPVQESYDAGQLCGSDQLLEIRSEQTPANVIASVLGLLNSATTVQAICARAGGAEAAPPRKEKGGLSRFFSSPSSR